MIKQLITPESRLKLVCPFRIIGITKFNGYHSQNTFNLELRSSYLIQRKENSIYESILLSNERIAEILMKLGTISIVHLAILLL